MSSAADEKSSFNGDAAVDAVDSSPAPIFEIDPAVERRVVRKLDCTVLIAFGLVFGLNYLDKIGLSYAAIFGMRTDLNFTGQDYSWCASVFYFGQFAAEYPCIWLLHKLPIRMFVAISIIVWAAVVACQAATQNFTHMMVVRFFLGFTEAAVSPAFVLMTSFFYRKKEQPTRMAVFISFNALAQIVGALLLYGCGSIKGGAIEGWRISFLICAALTVVVGVIFLVFVPESPGKSWYLTPEERVVAVQRVAQERASGAHSEIDMRQVKQTLLDVRFYLIFLWAVMVCITSVVTFGSIVISGFGFDAFKTLLIGLPGPGLQLVTIWIGAIAIYFLPNHRGFIQLGLLLVPLTGVVMMRALPYSAKWALTGGYWLATCNSSLYVVNLSLIASNTKGHTRKTVRIITLRASFLRTIPEKDIDPTASSSLTAQMFSVVYFIGYCVGCIAGPQLFLAYEKPLYRTAMNTIIGMYAVYFVAMLAYREICRRENNRRDRLAANGCAEAVARPAEKEDNKSDIDDLAFRYIL
ncbi:hypothetical protein C6P46_001047 [Rhodotorula mucilaginosa]|uniref:Major facilitator superfamily (MFS) profile domain-containing protein n=1 Tax=Rhodotorula mucilaginosa TaxID=5537 RepID=A0A9P6VUE5_RHOMI|nr:hypothetical protein C6P46_001047 [Rhodotorula mucilaginosa]